MNFQCFHHLNHTTLKPSFLLLFSVAKGKLEKMLKASEEIPGMDATSYDYHVLCSCALEVAPNWFRPVSDEIFKEEYEKLMKEDSEKKIDTIKKKSKQTSPLSNG